MTLVPVARNTASQAVLKQLIDLIRGGEWQDGARLPTEKELVEQLGVGRSTVREALQALATLNLVHAVPGHGTFIKRPGVAELLRGDLVAFLLDSPGALELLEAREMIEPALIRLACIRGTLADFDAIERLLAEHETELDAGRPVNDHAARFHVLLAQAAHNSVASLFISSILELLMQRGRRLEDDPGYLRHEMAEHRALLEAVRQRDPDRATALLMQHMVDSAVTYERGLRQGGRKRSATPRRRKAG